MIFRQWEQVIGQKLPSKRQTRRPQFPHELAVQLWKHGWTFPRERSSGLSWAEYSRHRITEEHIAEANRILAENPVTVPVRPARTEKAVGRVNVKRVRRHRLLMISSLECLYEGIWMEHDYWRAGAPGYRHAFSEHLFWTEKEAFFNLWDLIYGPSSSYRWKENPMVFCFDIEPVGGYPWEEGDDAVEGMRGEIALTDRGELTPPHLPANGEG